jgi:hypothetical protein
MKPKRTAVAAAKRLALCISFGGDEVTNKVYAAFADPWKARTTDAECVAAEFIRLHIDPCKAGKGK